MQPALVRQRNLSGELSSLNYWGPRRSARLIGIPAEDTCEEDAARVSSSCDEGTPAADRLKPETNNKTCSKLNGGVSKLARFKQKTTDEKLAQDGCCCDEPQPIPNGTKSPDGYENCADGPKTEAIDPTAELAPCSVDPEVLEEKEDNEEEESTGTHLPLKKRKIIQSGVHASTTNGIVAEDSNVQDVQTIREADTSVVPDDSPAKVNGTTTAETTTTTTTSEAAAADEASASAATLTEPVNNKEERHRPKKKARMIQALLMESERFMQYPSRASCRSRSTYNSRDIRPPSCTPASPTSSSTITLQPPPTSCCDPEPPNYPLNALAAIEHVQFSFEIVPTGAVWFQTFLRDENNQSYLPCAQEMCATSSSTSYISSASASASSSSSTTAAAPFLLPYEMSLDTILKSNRAVRQRAKRQTAEKRKPKQVPSFRPIISTRLQMRTAASREAREISHPSSASSSSASSSSCVTQTADGDAAEVRTKRRNRRKFDMPRKSPRCHASTLAILCSKDEATADGIAAPTELQGIPEEDNDALEAAPSSDTSRKLKTGTRSGTAARIKEEGDADPETGCSVQTAELETEDNGGSSSSCLATTLELMILNSDATSAAKVKPERIVAAVVDAGDSTSLVPKRKRGRPRKYPIAAVAPAAACDSSSSDTAHNPIANLLATPLDRIQEIVDERIVHHRQHLDDREAEGDEDSATAGDAGFDELFGDRVDVDQLLLDCMPPLDTCPWSGGGGSSCCPGDVEVGLVTASTAIKNDVVMQHVMQSIQALGEHLNRSEHGGGSSVYETASDLGSTSTTGTCNSRNNKKWRRRKRNMTGWPRSKKRKTAALAASASALTCETYSDEGSEGADSLSDVPYLSPCRELISDGDHHQQQQQQQQQPLTSLLTTIDEEANCSKDSGPSLDTTSATSASCRELRSDYKPAKPFQFQRKTLKFVGKRILRQAAQRHSPQRLEYWPRFAIDRKRRRRK